jgi:hypothetical protein
VDGIEFSSMSVTTTTAGRKEKERDLVVELYG